LRLFLHLLHQKFYIWLLLSYDAIFVFESPHRGKNKKRRNIMQAMSSCPLQHSFDRITALEEKDGTKKES